MAVAELERSFIVARNQIPRRLAALKNP